MQINSTSAAIIAAVCGGAGVFLGAVVTALFNQCIENHKCQREERDIVTKYRDVLLQSSSQLQSHLQHLCEGKIEIPAKVPPSVSGPTV
jgi:hypothetical protein